MISLAGIIGNNSLGYQHGMTKVERAVRRSAGRVLDKVVIKERTDITISLENNKFIDVIWGTPDVTRLRKCFDAIARGLYRHHFGSRFDGSTTIVLGYLFHKPSETKTWVDFLTHCSEVDVKGKDKLGKNPDVFFYQVTDYDQFGLFLMKLCFYDHMNVYVAFRPVSSNPPASFTQMLIERGIQTHVAVDGKTYVFNSTSES